MLPGCITFYDSDVGTYKLGYWTRLIAKPVWGLPSWFIPLDDKVLTASEGTLF